MLEYTNLREANKDRQDAWIADSGNVPDLSFRGNELAGEVGEACNVIKKLERERHGWRGSRDTIEHLAEELADVVICADLIAISAGLDLDAAVRTKFNATSIKQGFPHRMAVPPTVGAWNTWAGGDMPVPGSTQVTVRFSDADEGGGPAGEFYWDWQNSGLGGDIVAYRVNQP